MPVINGSIVIIILKRLRDSKEYHIQIINSIGKEVYRAGKINTNRIMIDFKYPPGIYLIRLKSNDLILKKKIIKI